MRIPVAVAAIVLIGSTVAACGGSGGDEASSAYCKDLKKQSESLSTPSPDTDLSETFRGVHELAGKAPDDHAAEWKVVDEAYRDMEKSLKDIGLDTSKKLVISSLDGKFTEEQTEKFLDIFIRLGDDKNVKALDKIAKHAKDECKVDA